MFSLKVICFFLCITPSVSKLYHNYTLFRATPNTAKHVLFMKELEKLYGVKYWTFPGEISNPVDFVIGPERKNEFVREALIQNLNISEVFSDIQSAFDNQTVIPYMRQHTSSFNWNNYYRLADIYSWLKDLKDIYPSTLEIIIIGKTFEERDILMAKIVLPNAKVRSKVIIEGGVHAREWISISVVTYFLYRILTSPNCPNEALRKIANTYEWYFIPVLNPDGYEYTHVKDRMYRKNRRQVDINRNFDYGFGTVGVSHDKHSCTYCGPSAFSEAESIAIRTLLESKHKNLEYYLTFHSYGQHIIIPYGNSSKHVENFNEVIKMANRAADTIASKYGTLYTTGTAKDTVGYLASGSSACWVKSAYKVPYVVTFELRDRGQYGFALPTNLILRTCYETTAGLISFLTPRNESDQSVRYHSGTRVKRIWDALIFICVINIF